MIKKSLLGITVVSLLFLTACQSNEAENPTPPTPTNFVRTENSTEVPTSTPTQNPTPTVRTEEPTEVPTSVPTSVPTQNPTPTVRTEEPTEVPTSVPTQNPTPTVRTENNESSAVATPTEVPTLVPTSVPVIVATATPTPEPVATPTNVPTNTSTPIPTIVATVVPTSTPTPIPTVTPTETPIVTVEPTKAPTATPTVAPTATPKPTPIPGDDVGVEFDGTVTLDCGVKVPKLKDYNIAGLHSKDTKIYGWYGDGQDNRDNSKQLGETMTALEKEFGMYDKNGKKIAQGFYVSNFSAEFYWDSVGSTPDLALYRDVDNQCYYLAINYDLTYGGMVENNSKDRDVLRMLLSICSSNPIELENEIYTNAFGDNYLDYDEWGTVGDSQFCFPDIHPINGWCVITIKNN